MAARCRTGLLLLLATMALACSDRAVVDRGPDVLLITVDTLRADRLGTYGFQLGVSPAVDRLARTGVVFVRAISAASFTAPSHATIMTSRYTREHTIGFKNGDTRLEGIPTLAEMFSRAGYRTGAFVGNVVLQRRIGFDRGFDHYDDERPQPEQNRKRVFERIAEQTTERAMQWIGEPDPRPMFVWVHYQDPHGPYTPPAEFRGRFPIHPRPGERPLEVLEAGDTTGGIPAYQKLGDLALPSLYESRYVEEIAYADEWIGRLVTAFDAATDPTRSIVTLTGDHGESLGEQDRYFVHGTSTTPDQAHVPLIIRAPGLTPMRSKLTVHHVDVMPTVLELAGLDLPTGISGVALGPILRGFQPMPERYVYCDDGHNLSAYGPDGFVRVYGLSGAWKSPDGSDEPSMNPLWENYQWQGGVDWTPRSLPPNDEREPIREYMRNALPMAEAPAMTPVLSRMLRALGYGS